MEQAAIKLFSQAKKFIGLESIKEKMVDMKVRSFEPKISFSKDFNNYRVKTAQNPADLKRILRLRHEIFVKDLDRKTNVLQVDFDRYDLLGDHIMIIDRQIDEVIGTYRVIASQFASDFYSQNEFEIDSFLQSPGRKLELGRACIHRDFRNGSTLHLVWKGLAHYIKQVDADFLFGCSSVWTDDEDRIEKTLAEFEDENFGLNFKIQPKFNWRFSRDFALKNNPRNSDESKKLIPPLLSSYVKAGAKIYGQPAYDRDFSCADVFTVLEMKNINPRYYAKYFKE